MVSFVVCFVLCQLISLVCSLHFIVSSYEYDHNFYFFLGGATFISSDSHSITITLDEHFISVNCY